MDFQTINNADTFVCDKFWSFLKTFFSELKFNSSSKNFAIQAYSLLEHIPGISQRAKYR